MWENGRVWGWGRELMQWEVWKRKSCFLSNVWYWESMHFQEWTICVCNRLNRFHTRCKAEPARLYRKMHKKSYQMSQVLSQERRQTEIWVVEQRCNRDSTKQSTELVLSYTLYSFTVPVIQDREKQIEKCFLSPKSPFTVCQSGKVIYSEIETHKACFYGLFLYKKKCIGD